ncbi:MAG: TolC family protein [Myxococcota bacterium]|nr:TolC family protein [Myxococcota bacterium]MDW8360777.1 TolC family protein [Myxococcales bacterium]
MLPVHGSRAGGVFVRLAAILVGVVSTAPAACLPYRSTLRSDAQTFVPDRYASGDDGAGGRVPRDGRRLALGAESPRSDTPARNWWQLFGDPALDDLVERARAASPQLLVARARADQALAARDQIAAGRWWPQVSAQIEVSRRRQNVSLPEPLGTRVVETDTFSASVPVAWELDVFRRVDAAVRGAELDARAAAEETRALETSVAAAVVEAWLDVVHQRALARLLDEQLETQRTYLELLELRFAQGLSSALDVFTQRQQLDATRAQRAATEGAERQAIVRLALLVGIAPGELDVGTRDELPEPPRPFDPGAPSDLLRNRPDVRAARARLEAADRRVGAAVAERWPRLVLTGSFGWSSPELRSVLERWSYSVGGSLSVPLVDGGRRAAAVEQAEAVARERLHQLAQVLLTALSEVESALAAERSQREVIAALEARRDSAAATLREARERYAAGLLGDYLPVATALGAVHATEQQLLLARRQLLSHWVQLVRALGGTLPAQANSP